MEIFVHLDLLLVITITIIIIITSEAHIVKRFEPDLVEPLSKESGVGEPKNVEERLGNINYPYVMNSQVVKFVLPFWSVPGCDTTGIKIAFLPGASRVVSAYHGSSVIGVIDVSSVSDVLSAYKESHDSSVTSARPYVVLVV